MKTLITGGNGNLATELSKLMPWARCPGKKDLDIRLATEDDLNGYDVLINCAAVTDVDACEGELEEISYRVNEKAPVDLYHAFTGKLFIQISSASVFGSWGALSPETGFIYFDPLSVYSANKLAAEQHLEDAWEFRNEPLGQGPHDYSPGIEIIRTGWLFGGDKDKKFMYKIRDKIRNHNEDILAVDDIEGQIMHVKDLVRFIAEVVKQRIDGDEQDCACLHRSHAVAYNTCSRYDLAKYMAKNSIGVNVVPVSNHMFGLAANRPSKEFLSVFNTEKRFGLKFRSWQEMVDDYLLEQ